jgi:hypothetical protein
MSKGILRVVSIRKTRKKEGGKGMGIVLNYYV